MQGRRMCVTEKGYSGLVPLNTLPDDIVVVFPGAAVPFILRDVDIGDNEFRMVGECYLHDIMNGEVGRMTAAEVGNVRIV